MRSIPLNASCVTVAPAGLVSSHEVELNRTQIPGMLGESSEIERLVSATATDLSGYIVRTCWSEAIRLFELHT